MIILLRLETKVTKFTLLFFFLTSLFILPPLAVDAQIRVAVGTFITANTNTAPVDAERMESAFRAALAHAIFEANESGECDIVNVDIGKQTLQGRATEKMLMDTGLSPKDGVKIEKFIISDVINGVVGFDGDGGFDFVLQSENLISGKKLKQVEGNSRESTLGTDAEKAAKAFVDEMCKYKPFRLQARFNDLQIDALICDPTKPFTFNGRGATAGLKFSLTPSGDAGGSWTVAGKAGGVPWDGGGSYVQALDDKAGTLKMKGKWTLHSPVGSYSYAGTIPGKVTKLATTQCAGE
jgi:hypothetical protein